MHALHPGDRSADRLAYGKVLGDGDRHRLPLSIDFRHGLVDGLHVARLVKFTEEEAKELARSIA